MSGEIRSNKRNTKGFSEKFKHIVNPYNTETIFETKKTFRGSTMRNKPHTQRPTTLVTLCTAHPTQMWPK